MTLRRTPGKTLRIAVLGLGVALGTTAAAPVLGSPPAKQTVEIRFDSGYVENASDRRSVIFRHAVTVPDVAWLRLQFDHASLGAPPPGGVPTVLRLTSLLDGAVQTFTQDELRRWRFASAYFNGHIVLVEVEADPDAGTTRISSSVGFGGVGDGDITASICGPDDDRTPSDDPRVGRIMPGGCTAWLVDHPTHCLLTAGHCAADDGLDLVEFNVPMSTAGGALQHPAPDDQYPIDPASIQYQDDPAPGADWSLFCCETNSESGLRPHDVQGPGYVLASQVAPPETDDVRVTGFGITGPPIPDEWNQVQKTHVGPYVAFGEYTVEYLTDTTGGNSGSPVVLATSEVAIAVHTSGGCSETGGENFGTAVDQPNLLAALGAPLGICMPIGPLSFSFPDGLHDLIPSQDRTITVEISPAGGVVDPDSATLHYDDGTGFATAAMTWESGVTFTATFPAGLPCGAALSYYFTAETTDGVLVTHPYGAPAATHAGVIGDEFDYAFHDDFESNEGWSVSSASGLTSGEWERGVPAGDGSRGDPVTDGDGSGQAFVTGVAGGDNDVDNGWTRLTSPRLDATEGDAHLVYWRWFSNTAGANTGEDVMTVDLSDDDGLSWTELEVVGPDESEADGGWALVQVRVADHVEPTDELRLRFTTADEDGGSLVEAGVDGVRLLRSEEGVVCETIEVCPDFDGNDVVNIDDLLVLVADFDCTGSCQADLNDDGVVSIDDLLILIAFWGACP